MSKFKMWLESQVQFGGMDSWGGIEFYVNGVKHKFQNVDTSYFHNGFFAKWIDRHPSNKRNYNPEAAFKFIKGLVEKRQAIQVEPAKEETPKVPKTQNTLFPM